MKKFWSFLARHAVKLAVYAADHPDQVIAIVSKAKAQRKA